MNNQSPGKFRGDQILVRLSNDERGLLQLAVEALKISEYADDFAIRSTKDRLANASLELRDFLQTVIGLFLVGHSLPSNLKDEIQENNISAYTEIVASVFEVFRRYKHLNPHSHRSEFGKLAMILQDAQCYNIIHGAGFYGELVKPLKTVGDLLQSIQCEKLLHDPDLKSALTTKDPTIKGLLIEKLILKYDPVKKYYSELELSIRSIDDVLLFKEQATSPLHWLIQVLKEDFFSMSKSSRFNLNIQRGYKGSLLSHSHPTQCKYVLESLTLWVNVLDHIFDLWNAMESDMFYNSKGIYRLVDTGQGYHRVCNAPVSLKKMSQIVRETQAELGEWIGISVIHLGDNDVPNPLVFIDKYTSIPKIVTPVVQTVKRLKELFDENESLSYPGIRELLVRKYSSYEELYFLILSDFFRHGFDGSGSNGGNCIDGRLTSVWNWSNLIAKKSYYDAFVLTGFTGFD